MGNCQLIFYRIKHNPLEKKEGIKPWKNYIT